ncbi:MAG: hypothetical protein WCT45_00100 [Candidatus Paceibacterota bacterium]|jgi:hypothetical protein
MQTAIVVLEVLSATLLVLSVVMATVILVAKQYQGLPHFRGDSEWQGWKIAFANWLAEHRARRYLEGVLAALAATIVALSFLTH